MKYLQVKATVVIKQVPDKPNCKFSEVQADEDLETQFSWLAEELKDKRN